MDTARKHGHQRMVDLLEGRNDSPATGPAASKPGTQASSQPGGKPVVELWDGGIHLLGVKPFLLLAAWEDGPVFPDGPVWHLAVRHRGEERILDCDPRRDWEAHLKTNGPTASPSRQETEAFLKMWGECIQVLARLSVDGWRPWKDKPPLDSPPQPGDAASKPTRP